jgi:hypothetical protein
VKKRKNKIYAYSIKMDEYLHIKTAETEKVKKLTAAAVLKEFNLNPTECHELLTQVFNELESMEITEENTDK